MTMSKETEALSNEINLLVLAIGKLKTETEHLKKKLSARKTEVKSLTNSNRQWKEEFIRASRELSYQKKLNEAIRQDIQELKDKQNALFNKQKVLFKTNVGLNRSHVLIECYERVSSDKENSCGY
jgi:chromosome segregation ATPase